MLNNIDKEIKCVSLKKRKIKVSQNTKFLQYREIKGVAKYAILKIANLTCCKNLM